MGRAGYGIGIILGSVKLSLSNYADVNSGQLGPLYLKLERGVSDHIGLGLNLAYVRNKWSYLYNSYDSIGNPIQYRQSLDRNSYSVLAHLNFHIGNSEKFDPYVGFGLVFRHASWKYDTNDPNDSSGIGSNVDVPNISFPLGFELGIGARYIITPNLPCMENLALPNRFFRQDLC